MGVSESEHPFPIIKSALDFPTHSFDFWHRDSMVRKARREIDHLILGVVIVVRLSLVARLFRKMFSLSADFL